MAREPFAARLTCIWIGAAIFFICKGFKGGIQNQLESKYDNRNFWTGYVFSLLLLGGIIYLVIT